MCARCTQVMASLAAANAAPGAAAACAAPAAAVACAAPSAVSASAAPADSYATTADARGATSSSAALCNTCIPLETGAAVGQSKAAPSVAGQPGVGGEAACLLRPAAAAQCSVGCARPQLGSAPGSCSCRAAHAAQCMGCGAGREQDVWHGDSAIQPCVAACTARTQRDCGGEAAHACTGSSAAPSSSAAFPRPSACADAEAQVPMSAQAILPVQGGGAGPAKQRQAAADAEVGTGDAAAPAPPRGLAQAAPPARPQSDSMRDPTIGAASCGQAGTPAAAQRLRPVGITTFTEARAACQTLVHPYAQSPQSIFKFVLEASALCAIVMI